MKTLNLVTACAALALFAAPAVAQQKPQEKPKETTVVIKDDTTPKVKKGAKAVSDTSITTAVNTRLMKEKLAHDKSIVVHTKAGVVTLTGTVPTEADKAHAAEIAEHTTGVKSVENNLTVAPVGTAGRVDDDKDTKIVIKDDTTPAVKKGSRAVTDASVTTAVKTRLMTDDVARATSIDVDTSSGVVTIAGTVPNESDKTRIGQLVARTTGVKRVVNNLAVK
jgi:hyperosmotically inducible protein